MVNVKVEGTSSPLVGSLADLVRCIRACEGMFMT
jgi:hypothetical protein